MQAVPERVAHRQVPQCFRCRYVSSESPSYVCLGCQRACYAGKSRIEVRMAADAKWKVVRPDTETTPAAREPIYYELRTEILRRQSEREEKSRPKRRNALLVVVLSVVIAPTMAYVLLG